MMLSDVRKSVIAERMYHSRRLREVRQLEKESVGRHLLSRHYKEEAEMLWKYLASSYAVFPATKNSPYSFSQDWASKALL